MRPPAVLCFLLHMLNRRRLVFFVVLLPCLLVAGQFYLKEGSVVEGTILQPSRTTIQIRTVDGVKTISKDDIRRIDYGKEAKAERKLEAERIKEAQRQKEAERAKELEPQEALKREAEASTGLIWKRFTVAIKRDCRSCLVMMYRAVIRPRRDGTMLTDHTETFPFGPACRIGSLNWSRSGIVPQLISFNTYQLSRISWAATPFLMIYFSRVSMEFRS